MKKTLSSDEDYGVVGPAPAIQVTRGHDTVAIAASLARINAWYVYLVDRMAVTDEITPKMMVNATIRTANQNVYHCKTFRRSLKSCVMDGGGEQNSV